jgi:hypothetical protein
VSWSRSLIRVGLPVVLASQLLGIGFAGRASAAPVCATTPTGTNCVDPTGTCLITFYPNHGPALCLKNPIGGIVE